MPYIPLDGRTGFSTNAEAIPADPGQLNYAITAIIVRYIRSKGTRYQTFNDVLGALEGAKLEFYRRVVVPYEEGKRELNGDVYR